MDGMQTRITGLLGDLLRLDDLDDLRIFRVGLRIDDVQPACTTAAPVRQGSAAPYAGGVRWQRHDEHAFQPAAQEPVADIRHVDLTNDA